MRLNDIIKTKKIFAITALSVIVLANSSVEAAPVPGYESPLTMDSAPEYVDPSRGVYVPSHDQLRLRSDNELDALTTTGKQYAALNSYGKEMDRISGGPTGMEAEVDRIARGTSDRAPMNGYKTATNDYNHVPQANSQGGVEIAVGRGSQKPVDMTNSLVKVQEERVSVRRVLQRMMDQIGAGDWTIVWDLADRNVALPDMEISMFAEEPFMNVLNALIARVQTRSGQPLRVVRYDNRKRLIITDRSDGSRSAGGGVDGYANSQTAAVTENVLKEGMVSLHHDEIPLVDALENMVNQAGKGEWRLRVYAGLDQVLKPAHIEEPFAIALERVLQLFNLKYEVFPGGKLIVITHNNRFGFRGVE